MKVPKFPYDFQCSKNAVPISHETVNKWIEQCINDLEGNKGLDYQFISSGDTKVTVYRLHPEDGKYDISVVRNECDYTIF